MKYCIYARVSTTYDSQDLSFDIQTKELKKKVKALYPTYTYVATYGDQGISGKKESRPQFQQMLKDARAKKFDVIVTKSISRFARNTRVLLSSLEELGQIGIKVLFIEENIDSSSASQKFLLTVLGGLAEMEAQNTSSHIRESNNIRRVAGSIARPCAACVGYTWDKKTKTISVNEDEAELVNQIFHWYVDDDLSQGKIAALVTNSGFKPKHGGLRVDRKTITKILSNKKYIGVATEHDTSTGKTFEFEGIYPPIVDKTLFEKAQEILIAKKKPDYRKQPRKLYPLSHLVFCSCCNLKGTRFVDLTHNNRAKGDYELAEPSGGLAFWGCRSLAANRTTKSCKTYKMSEEYIYEAIIEALVFAACGSSAVVADGLFEKDRLNGFLKAIEDSNKNFDAELVAFENRKKELEKQRKKELDLFRNDLIDETELKANVKVIDKQLKELVPPKSPETTQMNQQHLKSFLKAVKTSNKDMKTAQSQCREHLFFLFQDADFRRSIVSTFVDKVWIGGDKFTVTVELKEPLVSYSHCFKHRAPCTINGHFIRENFE